MKTVGLDDAVAAGRTGARRSLCPVACALDVVGDRWTLLVIRDMLGGKRRFSDFLASAEKIPTNILAERLKRLEREGLIARVPYSSRPLRVEYRLTVEGRELGRAVDALATWGLEHCPGTVRSIWPETNSGEAHADTASGPPERREEWGGNGQWSAVNGTRAMSCRRSPPDLASA